MDVTKETLGAIMQLAQPNYLERHGLTYSDKPLHKIAKPGHDTHEISSLLGIVVLFQALRTAFMDQGDLMVMVQSPEVVFIRTQQYKHFTSDLLVRADAYVPDGFHFNQYYEPDEFAISLLTQFKFTPEIDTLFQLTSRLTSSVVLTAEDSQISQRVTLQTGVATKEGVNIKPIWNLQPYRTFLEIEQPESPFLFRLKSVKDQLPKCGLFEVDGGKWKMTAKASMLKWLSGELPADALIVA